MSSSGAFYTNFAQRKFGNGKRIISFPFPRGCMFYTFSGAEEIGNGNSASSSHGFTDASRSRHFLWQNDTYRRFLPRLRCAAVLTQLITRAVINMSTSNNQRLIRQLRCRDLDPRTKAEFCGLVVQALVESGTLKVSKWMAGRRGSPNWARGHFDMDSHLIALQKGILSASTGCRKRHSWNW
jgi:hypothetical protein